MQLVASSAYDFHSDPVAVATPASLTRMKRGSQDSHAVDPRLLENWPLSQTRHAVAEDNGAYEPCGHSVTLRASQPSTSVYDPGETAVHSESSSAAW